MAHAKTPAEALGLAQELLDHGHLSDASALCSRILAAAPGYAPALHLSGIVAWRQGDLSRAIQLLRKAVAADPAMPNAFSHLGNLLVQAGNTQEAILHYRRAVELAPGFAEAHNNLANALQIAGQHEEAERSYRTALRLAPSYAEAWRNLGSALRHLGKKDDAVACFEKAVALNPAFGEALIQLLQESKTLCDWRRLDSLTARVVELVDRDAAALNPFVFLSLDTTARRQLRCARRWAAEHLPASPPKPAATARAGKQITVGYLSADFQEHATAHLAAGLFELHDRDRFRVIAYSYGADDGGEMRRRLTRAFDAFVDIERLSHADAAARISADHVDILVDLKGYTQHARPHIAALRPAPVQVSYLGYPGTMGTEAIDYLIADPFVVPPEQQPFFTEKLVHLPGCYQVNDSSRPVPLPPSRAQCGLPEAAFVFCCLSVAYKFSPVVFDLWIRLLAAVPDSVLWLLDPGEHAAANLRREAEARLPGSAARLIFAPSLPNRLHLERLAAADLFLDTFPYNAHTVASDALWAGCPVVTCAGDTFPSRVAGSLLHAVGLPELVTDSFARYEAAALRLARDRTYLASLRERLGANRLTAPLFDTLAFTRHLESAFEQMWHLHRSGESPRPIAVSPGGEASPRHP